MSYFTPPLGTNPRPTESHTRKASSASVSDAPRKDDNDNAQFFFNPIANAVHHDLMNRSSSLSSEDSKNGLQPRLTVPSGLRTHSIAHADHPTFPPTPITPTQAPGFDAVTMPAYRPRPMAPEQNVPFSINLSYEALDKVVGSYDDRIRTRLAALDLSLRNRIDHRFSLFSDILNTKLAEVKEQKRVWSTENLRVELESWKATMLNDTKIVMQEAVEEAMKRVGDGVLNQVNALGRLTLSLGEKAGERHNIITSDLKDVQSTGISMQSHLDSLDARMKSIEDFASAIASSYSATPFSSRTPHHTSSSLTVIPSIPQVSIPAGTCAPGPEDLTHPPTLFQSYFTKRMSQTDDTLVELAKMITVSRDEAHSGKEELAAMLEKSHVLQSIGIESLQKEVHTLKTAVGVIDPSESELEMESDENRDSVDINPEISSLADRMQALEKNQHILMKYFENSMDQGPSHEKPLAGELMGVHTTDQVKHPFRSISSYFDISTSAMHLVSFLQRLSEEKERRRECYQNEVEIMKKEGKHQPKAEKVRPQDSTRSRSENKRRSMSLDGNKKGNTIKKREGQLSSPLPFPGPSSSQSLSIGKNSPPALEDAQRDSHSNDARSDISTSDAESESDVDFPSGEALLASRSKGRNECSPPATPPGDTDDEYLPPGSFTRTSKMKGKYMPEQKKTTEWICPRPTCGRIFKHRVNLYNHSARELCQDLKEAKHAKPHEPQMRQKRKSGSLSVPPLTAHATKRQRMTDSSAIMKFADRRPRGTRKLKAPPKPGNKNSSIPSSSSSQPAQPSASSSRSEDTSSLSNPNADVARKKKLVKICEAGRATPTTSVTNAHWPEKAIGKEVFDRQLIQCDICNNYYHYRCVGVKEGDDAIKLPNVPFRCPPCSEITAESSKRGAKKVKAQPRCTRPDCDWFDAQDIFVVDKILGRALSDPEEGRERYFFWLVKWSGYPATYCRWEPTEDIGGADKLIEEFYAAAEKEGLNHRSHDLLILKEAVDGGYRIPIGV